jgi:2-oxoglutarate dehydrogenase E1 component
MVNLNNAFIEDLYYEFLKDPDSVNDEWKSYFANYKLENTAAVTQVVRESVKVAPVTTASTATSDNLQALSNIQQKIAENMEYSLNVPTATSARTIPVKALDENRRVINKYLAKVKRNKISFTHLMAWAIIKALNKYPFMNDSFVKVDGKSYRQKNPHINIGFAVDVVQKGGNRILLVPNVKEAEKKTFIEFIDAYDKLVDNSRKGKINPDDLVGTTVSITNPGMIGTNFSNPRLMQGQGLIIATGSIDYPNEFKAVRNEVLTQLAISKVTTITSTYDHRIIQGAESAEFLQYLNKLLLGEEFFYDQIFANLKIPFEPIKWTADSVKYTRFGQFDEHEIIEKSAHVMLLINAYRVRGHLLASVNPLGHASYYYPELDPSYYGFNIWDLDRLFHADDSWNNNEMTLRDIIELLRDTYCGHIGVEFMHMQESSQKEWVKEYLESSRSSIKYSNEEKIHAFRKLLTAEEFENFLHTKFVGHKRFSLEGSESLIVMLDKINNISAKNDAHSVVIGMAHRGRLNVLANTLGKNLEKIFAEFDGEYDPSTFHGSGDVKYHLGDSGVYEYDNKSLNIVLAPNPSHLELVDPVIEGMAKAIQTQISDHDFSKVIPVLIHGDNAFAGQGIVPETLNLSQLEGYKTGGTIHIVVNNQIGFTTTAEDARSTVYATDIAKMIQVPIIHVNGNDPEAITTATIFAYEYRNKFGRDVVIDILCYRKYGHNEGDEPTYTQPLLYKKIRGMKPISEIYKSELIKEKVFTEDIATEITRDIQKKFYDIFINRAVNKNKPRAKKEYHTFDVFEPVNTAISNEDYDLIANAISTVPEDFKMNPKVKTLLKKRREMSFSAKPEIDWALGEAFGLGSLVIDGNEVRFTGQDSRRGTFSQRHAVLTDIESEEIYTPINHIKNNQQELKIYDSPLSEIAVMGFEFGYSMLMPDSLTIWEAQFGDFANNAQSMVDQFICSSESKWLKTCNLTLLLPHSYDGQGPEHSSARLERYLQLCAEENMIVGNLTTPAQYFHALRRQVKANWRKPLVLMTPKGMLRHPMAVSIKNDFISGGFQEIIDDNRIAEKSNVNRLVFCTGKVYYDLMAELLKNEVRKNEIAVIRIEQIYPFHHNKFSEILKEYPNAQEFIWLQEEPKNMGAWTYICHELAEHIPFQNIKYVGRKAAAAPATGFYKKHVEEQNEILRLSIE